MLTAAFSAKADNSENSTVHLPDTTNLQEVSITAIKQSERLFSQPVAASVIDRSEIERLNAASVKAISDVVPNFYIPDYGSRITSSIYVRGIGARMDQPAVGLNIDNVPVLNKDAYDFDMADIASIEMLRGPQSTLYGRNTMAGQINISTLSPLRWQGWRAQIQYISPLAFRGSLGWYGLLRKGMGLSVVGGYSWSKGIFKNEYNGRMADPERIWNARIKYEWRISPSVTLMNVASASGLHQGGYPYESAATGKIAYNDTCFYRRFLFSDGLTLRWRAPHFTLSSITSVQYIDDNMTLDQDFLPLDYFTLTQKKRETAFTQDILLRSTADGDALYHWIAGAFGFYKHLHMQAPVTFLDYGISQLIEKHRNDANPSHPIEWDTREFPLNSDFTIPTWGVSLYHESAFRFGRWKLTAGLRLDYEHVAMRYHSFCNTGYSVLGLNSDGTFSPERHVPIDIDDRGHLSRHFINLLPRISALWNFDTPEPGNIYLSLSKGYKSGGYNTQMFSDVLQQRLMGVMGIGAKYDIDDVVGYEPEKSWNIELGTHLSFFDSRLRTEIALFYIDCRDQQLTMFPDGNTTGRIMTNAGKTRSLGAEISCTWLPTENLSLAVSYGFTDARFRDFYNGIRNFKGKVLPYAPRHTLYVQALYALPVHHKHITAVEFDVNLRGTGKIYWDEANSLSQPFYLLPGASVTLRSKRWSLQIFGRNLSNTDYHTFYFLSIGNAFFQRGKPLQGGASFIFEL